MAVNTTVFGLPLYYLGRLDKVKANHDQTMWWAE